MKPTASQQNPFALTGKTLGIFWAHSKKYGWQMAAVFSGVIVHSVLILYSPLLYRDVVNIISKGISSETVGQALRLIIIIFALNLFRATSYRVSGFVENYFFARVMNDLTNTCYQYLQKHSIGFFSSNFVGSLVTKVKRYERSFEQIANQIVSDLGRSILQMGIVLGVLLWQYRTFGLILLAWCALYLLFSYAYSMFKIPYDIRRAAADTKTTGQLADSITNNVNIKLFTNYKRENGRFADVTEDQFRLRKKSWDLGSWGEVVQSISMIICEFVGVYIALKYWSQGFLNVGDIVLIQAYFGRMFDQLWNTSKNIRVIYEALADANEMTEMLLKPHEIQDAPGAKILKAKRGEIVFNDVSFGYYREAEVLNHFNLRVVSGERVALIGPSGGGKSTVIKLLLRFYDIGGGKILIDGQNIAEVTQDSLRAALSFVPQDPILFHRSLMENIRYAKPEASDAAVIKAAKLAHAHEFIESFRQGYDTLVGERGIKLSGGERQRVAIARALLRDAPILVLDEATSSLDSESEMYIQIAMKKLMEHCTTIVITHHLSTIMQMDRIVVIDGGKIVEEGKHKELLKMRKGIYQKLWEIQAGGFAGILKCACIPPPAFLF